MDARDPQLPGATLTPALLSAMNGRGPWKQYALMSIPFQGGKRRVLRVNSERKIKNRNEADDIQIAVDAMNRAIKTNRKA